MLEVIGTDCIGYCNSNGPATHISINIILWQCITSINDVMYLYNGFGRGIGEGA